MASSAEAGALVMSDEPANVHKPKAIARDFSIRYPFKKKANIGNQCVTL
jgi:hypothetical protein